MQSNIYQRGRQRYMLPGSVAQTVATGISAISSKSSKAEETAIKTTFPAESEPAGTVPPVAPDPMIPPALEPLTAEELARAEQFLRQNITVDVHCHPGMFFFYGMTPEEPKMQNMALAVRSRNAQVRICPQAGLPPLCSPRSPTSP